MTHLAELASIVLHFAPTVATALISPYAAIALKIISTAFGGDPTKAEEILAAVKGSPNQQNILQELEEKYGTVFSSLISNRPLANVEINIKLNWDNGQS